MPAKTKVCTKCGKRKKLEEYYARRIRKDGKRSECKLCDNAARIRRGRPPGYHQAYYQKNRTIMDWQVRQSKILRGGI